jgi:hypothetical protein
VSSEDNGDLLDGIELSILGDAVQLLSNELKRSHSPNAETLELSASLVLKRQPHLGGSETEDII